MGEPPGDPQLLTDVPADADVHAFLIADVRGWTAFTQERGDEDAARLAGHFADVTRAVVEDHRGRVLELRGDEALVVFGSPRSAIRGAVALQQRFVEETVADPSLPLTVGIGLDAGEAVPVEGGYRGSALNVAARLCSLARAGEVLASREIVHLAQRVDGVRFTERGPADVKGLAKPVHVVAVRSEDRDDAEAIAPFVRLIASPPIPWWRRKALVGAVAVAVLAAVIAVPLLARNDGGSSEIEPNSIGILDPDSGEVVETIGPFGSRPGTVAASEDAVWATNPDAGTVTQFDPNEQQIRDTIQVGENPTGIAVGFDAVWVVNSGGPSVSRISTATGEPFDPIPVGNGPAGIAVGEGAVWVTNRFDGTVSRIDPNPGGTVFEPIPVGFDPRGIAVGFGSVWVAMAGSNTVVRIDPESNELTGRIGVGNAPDALAISGDSVWAANTLDDTVSQIDPETNAVVDLVGVGDGPAQIAVVGGIVWVANESDGTLSRIEPTPTQGEASVRTVLTGSLPQGLAAVNGNLWVSVRGTATSHRGGTLRLVSNAWRPDSLDPAVSYDPNGYLLVHLMGDGLVAFEPVGGTSSGLVPDLATSLPTPTDSGRTYVFELRPGIRYSNGEVVVAGDFRRAFERGFALSPGVHRSLYGGLLGAEACGTEAETCNLSRGIVTDDENGTITFHLADPDPDFLYKLALGFAYPVPPGTPEEHQLRAGVPGTGPYMLEAPVAGKRVVLVRNPYFRVWSPAAQPDGYVDRIEWEWRVYEDPEDELEAIDAGEADLAFEYYGWGDLDDVFVRFAAQVHANPSPGLYFLVLDTDSPPFDDVNVRRAVNLVVDRELITTIWPGGGLPTCQQIPPNLPGYEPYCPYTANPGSDGEGSWTGPDLERAQRLVRRSGTSGMSIAFEYIDDWVVGPPMGEHLTEALGELGYQVTTTAVPFEEFFLPTRRFQIALAGWSPDYPAASTFFDQNLTCGARVRPAPGFCDPEIDAMIERAKLMQSEDPVAAGKLWAEVDRAIVDQAPYVWLLNPIDVAVVSERVGNFQWNFNWGILLNQLWVR